MVRFKMPKKATEPKERYEAVVNYIECIINYKPITKKKFKILQTAIKNLKKLAALAEKQGRTDPSWNGAQITLLAGFNWGLNCDNPTTGSTYWSRINYILAKLIQNSQ